DLGHTALFPALCGGGVLHLITADRARDAQALAAYQREHRVDCLKVTPSHLAGLLEAVNEVDLLPHRTLILGGEASSYTWIADLRRLRPECAIWNHYGPTECTVGALAYPVPVDAPATGPVPLG